MTVTDSLVELEDDEIRRTCTDCHRVTVPDSDVNDPQSILYSPHDIDIGLGILIPCTRIEFEL